MGPPDDTDGATSAELCVDVLGPLRVTSGGVEVALGGQRARTLLALLVASIDHVVTTDRLIEGVWGDDPPATAKKALQVHISNLRRELGTDFPLKTAPGGYVIQSSSLTVDALKFGEDVRRATAMLRTDAATASRLLFEALSAWRGPAYSDLGDEVALQREIGRLADLRLQALEHRVDADLRLGRHTEVLGELESITTDNPYRERLHAFHMLALYRSGRQTEALRAYQRTRSILVEELGIDPSPELQKLHLQILEQSSDLDLDDPDAGEHYGFLATDIEGSTALWEAEPDLMQEALARHDAILRTAVSNEGGRVFKETGDGIYAVFADAAAALAAAGNALAALESQSWPTAKPLQVRMGVDEGAASARGDDFFGPVLNRVSRIMDSGHGGQILLPAELAASTTTPTKSLGAVDYKGIGRIDVAQLTVDGSDNEFPELRTDRTPGTMHRHSFGKAIRGYELRERLGEGAHGIVYRAYQASVGREVAIKVIKADLANRTDFVKRFEAEAQFVAQLEHPHIVSLYDYWRDPDGAYLVMQLLRGGSLASSLERAPWRPPAAIHLLDQVGTALDYAHRQGVLHRDLKPANVLLDDEGNAYLTDFGIASHHIEAVGLPIESSAAYVSPEELAGDAVGTTADIYGLTLLAYETLTGERPELGASPRPVTDLRHDLPVALDAVLARGAHPQQEERYPRATDFLRALRQAFGADVLSSRRRDETTDVRNPFKGLRAFGETDALDFAGRETLIAELIDHVASHRLTAVVGPSGSGKSSLVRAGLVPAARRGELGIGGDLMVTEMFPGTFPFEELEAAVLRVSVDREEGMLGDLLHDDRGLLRVIKRILPDDDSELLLVIDQFEELFSLTTDESTRRLFLASIATAIRDERSRVRIVVTLRADYFDRPLAVTDFGPLLSKGIVPVAMPSREELAQAIARPGATAGLEFEAGLIDRIVGDVTDQPGALPLMQYALTELVDGCKNGFLTSTEYQRTGGVTGALAHRAEEIYEGLPAPTREVAREVFLRLVAVDEDSDDTRRRVRRSELDTLGLSPGALDQVVDKFGSFRLLSFDRDPLTRGPTIEVAHEALIREWPRFSNWIDERREDLLLERRLDAATSEWIANDRDPSYLVTAGRLEQFESWAEQTDLRLTDDERQFLADARRSDDERAASATSRRRRVMAAIAGLAVVAVLFAFVAVLQRNEADDKAAVAENEADRAQEAADRAIEAEQNAIDAVKVAAEEAVRADEEAVRADEALGDAVRLQAGAERSALINSASRLAIQAVDLSDEDQELALLLATEAHDRAQQADAVIPEVTNALFATTRAHRLVTRFEISPFQGLPTPARVATSVGPDSARIAALTPPDADSDSFNVDVLDLATGDLLQRLEGIDRPVSVHWDHVTGEVLVGTEAGRLSYWNPDTGEMLTTEDTGERRLLVHGTSGPYIAYGVAPDQVDGDVDTPLFESTGVVENRETGQRIIVSTENDDVRISPSGNFALVLDFDGSMHVHDLPSGEERAVHEIGDLGFLKVDWVAGRDAVWAIIDGTVFQIDLASGDTVEIDLRSSPNGPSGHSPSASPDGRWIAISQLGSPIAIYDARERDAEPHLTMLPPQSAKTWELIWTPDSTHLVAISDRDAGVFDLTERRTSVEAIRPLGMYPLSSAFIDDDVVAVAGTANNAELIDRRTGSTVRQMSAVGDGWAQLSDGTSRVSSTTGTGVGFRVEDLRSGEIWRVEDEAGLDLPLEMSADGRLVVVTTSDAAVGNPYEQSRFAILDIDSGDLVVDIGNERAQGAAFGPDDDIAIIAYGTHLVDSDPAFGGRPGIVAYDAQTGAELARLPDTDYVAFEGLRFSPDGKLFAVGGRAGEVVVYDFDGFLADPLNAELGRVTMPGEPIVSGLAFTEDGSLLLANTAAGTRVTAYEVGSTMAEVWWIETAEALFDITIHDDHLWIPSFTIPEFGTDGGLGLIAVPIDRQEFADFAREKATRGLTEAECEAYLRGPCEATRA